MGRASNRDKILTEGLKVVHARGFGASSVRDIVAAAGVPQGSFTNHFASKEAFGLEILDLYHVGNQALLDVTLRNGALTPRARIAAYVEASHAYAAADCGAKGCMLGNFSAEVTDSSELLRLRLADILSEVRQAWADCLSEAVAAGELAPLEVDVVAGAIVSGMQGAILMSKVHRSPEPVQAFERLLFSTILRPL
ncbi:MAG: TetR/AcrR family transcriptional regulator [Caulobacteraceae bacterium]